MVGLSLPLVTAVPFTVTVAAAWSVTGVSFTWVMAGGTVAVKLVVSPVRSMGAKGPAASSAAVAVSESRPVFADSTSRGVTAIPACRMPGP